MAATKLRVAPAPHAFYTSRHGAIIINRQIRSGDTVAGWRFVAAAGGAHRGLAARAAHAHHALALHQLASRASSHLCGASRGAIALRAVRTSSHLGYLR